MREVGWLSSERDQWLASAVAWITEEATVSGYGPVLEVSTHKERPWGATLRVLTRREVLYFKAVSPERLYEVSVTEAVAACSAMLGPELVASEATKGWMLMRDHGLAIAEVLSSERQ